MDEPSSLSVCCAEPLLAKRINKKQNIVVVFARYVFLMIAKLSDQTAVVFYQWTRREQRTSSKVVVVLEIVIGTIGKNGIKYF